MLPRTFLWMLSDGLLGGSIASFLLFLLALPRFVAAGGLQGAGMWWLLAAQMLGGALGAWGSVRLAPRRRSSDLAVDELRRARRRPPAS